MDAPGAPTGPAGRPAPTPRRLGAVRLTVADLASTQRFYEQVIGLRALELAEGMAALGATAGAPLVVLVERPEAHERPRRAPGLFHVALVVADRLELARALRRIAHGGWTLTGAADHLVSEALYLADPEGNGIEVYRDRPAAQWPRRQGELAMATLPLDLGALASELDEGEPLAAALAGDTVVGHVHLDVAELGLAERFYAHGLGLEITTRGYAGALFAAADGYHHHVGMNTWRARGSPPATPGSRGLAWWELRLDGERSLEQAVGRLSAVGFATEPSEQGTFAVDASGNHVLLRAG